MKTKPWYSLGGVLAILLASLLILWLGGEFRQLLTPYFLLNWDPDYAYLFNGLAIYSGFAPTHIDHPGTTLQFAITAYLVLSEWGASAADLYGRVVANPELYLAQINQGLVLVVALVATLAGILVWRRFQSLTTALLVPVGILLSPSTLLGLGRVAPEPLLVVASLLVLIVTVAADQRFEAPPGAKAVKWSGLLVGAGLATKLTFIPLLALVYYFARSRQSARRWLIHVGLGFIVGTLPWLLNWKNYYYFLRWFTNLSMSSGIYGHGPRTVIDASAYLPSLLGLVRSEWMYALVFAAAACFAWMGRSRADDEAESPAISTTRQELRRLLHALLIVHLVCFLLVAKHPQATRYLIPGAVLSGFTLALSVRVWGGGLGENTCAWFNC